MSTLHQRKISIAAALRSKQLFGNGFEGDSWRTWKAIAKAIFAEPLTADELGLFKEVAGDRDPPAHRVNTFAAAIGRGGGKNSIASTIAAYIAMSFDPRAVSKYTVAIFSGISELSKKLSPCPMMLSPLIPTTVIVVMHASRTRSRLC
jgi:hypothetical protein